MHAQSTLTTSLEAIEAYEKRSGLRGIGRFLQEHGLLIITEKKRCRPE